MVPLLATMLRLAAPDGPLHPVDAIVFASLGVSVAFVVGRHTARWVVLVLGSAFLLITVSEGDVITAGFAEHGRRSLVLATTAAVVAAAMIARMRWTTAVVVAVSGCAGVWAVVPDTEVPLMAGSLLLGAAAVHTVFGPLPAPRRWFNGALLLLPLAGAAAGSIGRPGRFSPALLLAVVTVVAGVAASTLLRSDWTRQRAGTPITVVPAGTSSVTTAPAATSAP